VRPTPPSRSRDARTDQPLRVPVRTTASSSHPSRRSDPPVRSNPVAVEVIRPSPARRPSRMVPLPSHAGRASDIRISLRHVCTCSTQDQTFIHLALFTSTGSKSQRSSPKVPGSQMNSASNPDVRVADMQTNVARTSKPPPRPARSRRGAEAFVPRRCKQSDVHPVRPPAGVGSSTQTIASSGSAASVQAVGPEGLDARRLAL
jgi:hypothetical protein